MFPFCGKLRGLELFGQYGDKRRAGGCGQKIYHLLGLFAFHKTGGHQLFNDTGTGCRGSDAFALRIVGHILFARAFHCRQQCIFCETLGRRSLAGLDRCIRYGKGLMLCNIREGGCRFRLFLFVALPAGSKNGLALGGETVTCTFHRNDRFRIAVCFADGTEQALCRQLQHFAFPQGQRHQIRFSCADGGDDGVVVGHFLVVTHLFCMDGRGRCHTTDSGGRRNKAADTVLHILGQKAAVGTGISTELLLIEGLEIIKGLLGGVAQDAVCIALECSQIVERRGFFCFFLSLHGFHGCCFTLAGVGNAVCGFSVLHSVCRGDKAAIKLYRVERFRDKCGNIRFPLY